jgi:antirestriction protein ArdC
MALPDSIRAGKPMRVRNPDTRDALADEFLRSTGADIREGHGEAYYIPSHDFIWMPAFEAFKGADHFYNVAFHELTHNAVIRIMPASVLESRKRSPPAHRYRHNQRDSRNASSLSSGRYLPGLAAGAVTRASAFSLSRKSA